MSDFGTFGAFTTARLGMYAAQKGLSVTGNNIANINTRGYTRQTLDQVSLKLGSNDRFQAYGTANVGSGVLCIGVSQLRDPYLDIRYRAEMSNVGAMDTKLTGLEELSSILDEVAKNDGDGILEKQLTDLMAALEDLSLNAGQDEMDSAVRSEAEALVTQIKAYASRLEALQKTSVDALRGDIKEVNNILTNIRDLNASIRESEIHGDSALEQRDQRNLLIDELSRYLKIDVTYTTENIGNDQTIEKLVIKLGNANPDSDIDTDSSTLVNGIFATQLLTPKANPDYDENATDGDPDSFLYLDINGGGTNDPSKAAQEFNENYDIMLGALKDSKDNVRESIKIEEKEITPPDVYIPGYKDPVDDGMGKKTITEHISKLIPGDPASVSGTAVNDLICDASKLLKSAIVSAAGGLGAASGDVTIGYSGSKLQLKIGNTVIGTSDEVTFPITADTTVKFVSTDNKSLGSIVLKSGATAVNFTARDTNLDFTAKGAETTKYYEKITTHNYSCPVALDDNDLYGAIQSRRELITEEGEFSSAEEIARDPNAVSKRGIPYYRASLDALANQLAKQFNQANTDYQVDQNGNYLDKNGKIFELTYWDPVSGADVTVTFQKGKELTAAQKAALQANGHIDYDASLQKLLDSKPGYQILPDGTYADSNGVPLELSYTDQSSNLQTVRFNANDTGFTQAQKDAFAANTDFIDYDASLKQVLDQEGIPLGGPLFSNHGDGNDTEGITASNISISKDWSEGKVRIQNTFIKPTITPVVDQDGKYLNKDGTKLELTYDNSGTSITVDFKKGEPLTADQQKALVENGYIDYSANLQKLLDANPNYQVLADGTYADSDGHALKLSYTDANGISQDATFNKNFSGFTNEQKAALDANPQYNDYDASLKQLLNQKGIPTGGNSGEVSSQANDNILHMIALMTTKLDYIPQDTVSDAKSDTPFIQGSFHEMLANMTGTLGKDKRSTATMLDNYYSSAIELDSSRDSVSSVDLNDEAMGLMQYQKSYSAAARLMTTLDEVLDKLINGTGVVGR